MMLQRKSIRLQAFLLALTLQAGLIAQNDSYFEVSKNLDIFTNLYKQVDINYVDEIDPGRLMKVGVDAMLRTLDPYTVYISEGDIEDYRFMTTGEYGGIGAVFHLREQVPEISECHQGFPADKAGLLPGDRLLEINGRPTKGRGIDEISDVLTGQPGTPVLLTIQRPSTGKTFEKEVKREKVKVDNIPYTGMLRDGVGYIRLSSFTQNAGEEVQKAYNDLMKEGGLKGLIIDLRGNGGGLLMEAVKICNLFVDKGQLIVSTKGKLPSSNNTYKTLAAPLDREIPLAVLIDGKSASASEIVSGALQDVDRAVIVGQRSFGKGLVQNVFPLSYNAQVKVTTAKYYIPSGRCIQAIDYAHRDENGGVGKLPDSLTSVFYTRNGRPVRDGGGIEPDLNTGEESTADLPRTLVRNYKIFDFATLYHQRNDTLDDPLSFRISPQLFNDFRGFLQEQGYDYKSRTEEALTRLEAMATEEGYDNSIHPVVSELREELGKQKVAELEAHRDEISRLLRLEIVSRYHYEKGRVISALSDDPDILKAIGILTDPTAYQTTLAAPSNGK